MIHSEIKHIEVRYHFLRDIIEKGKITLIHVPIHDQLANIFTKPLDQATFTRLREELSVVRTSLGPLLRWVLRPITLWGPRTIDLDGTTPNGVECKAYRGLVLS
jgi:hypothetical protein